MANNNCTSSVKELIENVKGTPYGVEVRRSKKGKPQAISFNETVDSFKDVIEDDCSNADKHGRFADTPASEGGAIAACEQYEADKAPCFSVGGKIKSTTVLKSRLAKKYKEKDSYEEYEDNKYKAFEGQNLGYQELISVYLNFAKLSKDANSFTKKIFDYYNSSNDKQRKFMNSFFMGNGNEDIHISENSVRDYFTIAKEKVTPIKKMEKEMKLDDLKEFKDDLMNHLRGKKKNVNTQNIQRNNFVNILAKFAIYSNNEKAFTKKVFDYYKKSSLPKKKIIRDFFYGGDQLDELAVKEYYPRIKDKVTPSKSTSNKKSKPVKAKKTIAKKKPTPQKQNSIPSEIFYQKTADGKCILHLTKVWYNKMFPQYQKQIKEYFKWNPYDKNWKCKKKGAESVLSKLGIPERNSEPLRRVTPEKVKQEKKKSFTLSSESRSIGQGVQQQLGLSFISRLERLEHNEKSIANVILSMKPQIDRIESDVEVIKKIVETEQNEKIAIRNYDTSQEIF